MRASCCVIAISATVVPPAFAQMTLFSESRSIAASSFVQTAAGTDSDGPHSLTPSSPGELFDANVSAIASMLGAGAPCSASQFSEFLPGTYTMQGSVSGIANVFPASGGIAASVFASSELLVSFTVPAGTQMTLQGSSSGVGGFTISGPSGVLVQDLGVVNLTTTMPTTFSVSAMAQIDLDAPPNASDGGGFSILITAVPAPGTAGLLALAGVCAASRRRLR